MGHETRPGELERGVGALFSLGSDGQLQQHLDKIDISNGLAWSHDNNTMYYIDSLTRKVHAFDYDVKKGTIGMSYIYIYIDCVSK